MPLSFLALPGGAGGAPPAGPGGVLGVEAVVVVVVVVVVVEVEVDGVLEQELVLLLGVDELAEVEALDDPLAGGDA